MTDTTNFIAANAQNVKEPRFTIEIAWDLDNTDLTYITSHADSDYPSTATSVYEGYVHNISGTSQQINPIEARSTIGNISVTIVDKSGDISQEINDRLTASPSQGLRGKRLRIYQGFKNLAWADYSIRQTQIIDSISYSNGIYTINCSDIQRQKRKDIFDLATTNLTQAIDLTTSPLPTTISVADTSDFEMCFHGPSYSDATGGDSPETIVGYLKIGDMIVRYTSIDSTTQFGGCTFGALNSKATSVEITEGATDDRQPKVEEFVYLELPAIKLAYAILTGIIYGDGHTLPSGWHLGISTNYITTADFTGIGKDLWDTSDDTAGFVCRFQGLKKQDGKAFLEKQIYLLLGMFSPVLVDGTLSLRRMTGILSDSPYVIELNDDNLTDIGDLVHDMTDLHNVFEINWNYDFTKDELTRHDLLIDQDSIDIHGTAATVTEDFYGLHGYSHTDVTLALQRDSARDRYTAPPQKITVKVLPSLSGLEVGNIVRLNTNKIRDYAGNITSIDRSFEIQKISTNWRTGEVSLDLFGSARQPTPISQTDATTSLSNAFYISQGTPLDSSLSPAGPLTISANHVTGNGTITGNADLTNDAAIYYHDGDLTIDSGVTVIITNNVQLRVKGLFTVNGTISGAGQGLAGTSTSSGNSGGIGCTYSQGGINRPYYLGTVFSGTYGYTTLPSDIRNISGISAPLLKYDGTNLTGIPTDLRGTSGAAGAPIIYLGNTVKSGSNGGAGGAGLCIISRGVAFGVNGSIDLSGSDGSLVPDASLYNDSISWGPNQYLAPGAGAGGAGGGCLYLIDGATAVLPDSSFFTSLNGTSTGRGSGISAELKKWFTTPNITYSSQYFGSSTGSIVYADSYSKQRITYIPENLTAAVDTDVPTPIGTRILQTTDYITTNSTAGQSNSPQGGQGIVISQTAITGYDVTGATKTVINAATGKITATNAVLNGATTSALYGDYAVFANDAVADAAVHATIDWTEDNDLAAVYGAVTSGNHYGGYFQGSTTRGPIVLVPSASASAPSHASFKGTLWVTSAGVLYINTDGSTTWAKVGAQ